MQVPLLDLSAQFARIRPDVPPHLTALIGRMMERDPERRIADPQG